MLYFAFHLILSNIELCLPPNYKIGCLPFLFNLFRIFWLLFIVSHIFFYSWHLPNLTVHPTSSNTCNIFLALHYIVLKTSFSCSMFHYCSTIQWFSENINFFSFFHATFLFFLKLTIFRWTWLSSAASLILLKMYLFLPLNIYSCHLPYFTEILIFLPLVLLSYHLRWFVETQCFAPVSICSISLNFL